MDRKNMPKGREKHVTSGSSGVHKRGDGLNMGGPVGNAGGYNDRKGSGSGKRSGGTRIPGGILGLIVIVLAGIFGGGSLFSDSGSTASSDYSQSQQPVQQVQQQSSSSGSSLMNTLGGYSFGSSSSGNGWVMKSNNGKLDETVLGGVRDRYTTIKGNGKDKVTIMVYMCGTDLESRNGMATSDLTEMASAKLDNDNVNILVYTGGCRGWKNNIVSSKYNQIYQVVSGGLKKLEDSFGSGSMTDYENLADFIKWCNKKYPANRNELILWDHGGGSVTGYGYDEKYASSGAMSLASINKALKKADCKFDFIGFDACLMATMENGLMLEQYADYMIASEESEPGYGWYYTDWITKLCKNPSMPTIEIGKQIADDFVRVCTEKGQGSITTLSVTDLAELGLVGPEAMSEFAAAATELINNNQYQVVSNARAQAHEFAKSNGIDQIDLAHMALNTKTAEGQELAKAICGAVKYNRVANNITNAYGLSVYFPYKKVSNVDTAVRTYKAIGMDDEYSQCIKAFASMETVGQVAAGGNGSPLGSLLGNYTGGSSSSSSSSYGSAMNEEMLLQVLGALMGGQFKGIPELDADNTDFLSDRSLEDYAAFVVSNSLDEGNLIWTQSDEGQVLQLSDEDWDKIQNLELNVFYDDGEGYIDLGLDNVYQFTESGDLLGEYDRTWLAIDGQPVAYYFMDEVWDGDDYTITGRVPAFLNGDRVDLILVFDQDHPEGYVEGARYFYAEGETDTVAKDMEGLKAGDQLDFVCDYYSYDGDFLNNYYLGETLTVGEDIQISNVDIGEGYAQATYRLTDLYNRQYWTPVM